MKHRAQSLAIAVGAVCIAFASHVVAGDPEHAPGDVIDELLGGIDYVGSKSDIDEELGDEAESDLIQIAGDEGPEADIGLRIRAIHALSQYPGTDTETVLLNVLGQHSTAFSTGASLLLTKTALDALAHISPTLADPAARALLGHAARDVRASAAQALATCGCTAATNDLRARLQIEPVEQVRFALQEALRVLEAE